MAVRGTEGPVWIAPAGVLLFSDIQPGTIHQLQPPATVAVIRMPSGNSNGLGLDAQGQLIASEHDNRRVSRTLADGAVMTVADRWQEKRLNSPNDNVTRSDSTIYFTDPPYGVGRPRELDFQGVFRVDPAGTLHLVSIVPRPTRWLPGTAHGIRAYHGRWRRDGGGRRGKPVREDQRRRAGVQAERHDLGHHSSPEMPTNCTFGGPDRKSLYITAQTSLYRVTLKVPGLP